MDFKKRLLFIIFLLSFLGKISAVNDTQAKVVLDKTAACISNKDGASANFQMSSGKIATTSGFIAIKGKKFYAQTAQAIVWYDGKTQWTYMKKTNEVNVSTPTSAQQISMNPYTFINMYRSGYNLTMKTIGNNYQVYLSATDTHKVIKEMYILINKNSYQPVQIKMHQKDGWITVNITNFKTKSIPNSTFIFRAKDYPTAEIIDLR
ncbi:MULTISPECIES: LolA-like putative outer membrane lipoprotein chaperone [Prevotellaceae]|uniref:LolA-like putative outer membrane lipoprotein chaperone n=1 Tax=Prevotellaceae TaxID=171552 RepID=UPI0003D2A013|nr:LolA-like putative outer membrane lipoprotein chaperone [Prevotella phocaeensis]ETD21119.1 hypothetical protein HMPREF1199_00182 [Hoylesella oralis CC98A]